MKRERFPSVKYYKFEIHPCVLLDDKNNPVRNDDPTGKYYEQCEANDPNIRLPDLAGKWFGTFSARSCEFVNHTRTGFRVAKFGLG